MKPTTAWSRLPAAVVAMLLLAAAPRGASSLKIEIGGDKQECVTEVAERAADTFTGSFMLVEENAYLGRWDGSFDLTVKAGTERGGALLKHIPPPPSSCRAAVHSTSFQPRLTHTPPSTQVRSGCHRSSC